MEFFDFSGTNDEEKAQALDIITHESSGVEFFFDYDTVYPNDNIHLKPTTYLHVNGVLPNQNVYENGLSQTENQENSFTSDISVENSDTSNNPSDALSFTASQSNWELINNGNSNSAILATSIPIQPNGATAPVVCASPQYIYHTTAPSYFAPAGPHNALYAPLPHGALPPLVPHSVTTISNQSIKDLKSMRMPSNSSNNSSSSSVALKNSSKHVTANVSNCDIRNSYYIPPSQYSEAHMLESNRLNASAIPIAGDGGAVMNEPNGIVSNGSAVVPPHLGQLHHQQPHAYSYPHAFPHTAAALFPHGPFTPPLYFIPADSSFIHYAPFVPTTAPTHISPISASHHQNVMPSQTSNIDLTSQNNQHSTVLTSAPSSVAATYSNLSSSISASSTSIAAAYHSSQSSQSGTPTSFEPVEESNTSTNSNNYMYENSDVEKVTTNEDNENKVDLKDTSNEKVPFDDIQSKTEFKDISKPDNETTISSDSEIKDTNLNAVDKLLSKYVSLQISTNKQPSQEVSAPNSIISTLFSSVTNKSSPQKSESIKNEVSGLPESTQESGAVFSNVIPTVVSTVETTKTTGSTWASKLFGSGSNNNNNNSSNNHNEQQKQIISVENKNEVFSSDSQLKSNLSNGIHAESNNKTFTLNNQNVSRRNRSSNFDFDDSTKTNIISMNDDPVAYRIAKRLKDSIQLKHSLPTIMPCGLVNRGNWCYINATLQALLACPPFYNLMREISETPGLFRKTTSTPIIDNFARYFSRFLPTDYKRQMKSAGSSHISYLEELLNNEPFEPFYIYDTLKHIGMIKNDAQRGLQEDAEEFLSSVLNGLHEEMIKLSNLLNEAENEKKNIKSNGKPNGYANTNGSQGIYDSVDKPFAGDDENCDSDDNIWREVGTSKHKSLPTRSTKMVTTAITEIFGGSTLDIRTVNKNKDLCGNRQPFFALQLDIKPPSIRNLDDAIRWQTRREMIQGYTCSKTKQVVEASSQMFLETLPPILILHLKLFDYDIETGAGRKLLKRIEFSENFEIPRECVSGKVDNRCKRYKLLGVVYHNGSETVKGHYITDVYLLGLNQWLRCDDSSIKVISLSKVLAGGEGNLVPYLLFYRRHDTLYSNSSSNTANASYHNNNSNVSSSYNSGANFYSNNKYQRSANNNNNNNNDLSVNNQHNNPANYSTSHSQTPNEVTINTSNKFSSFNSRHF